jgi:hypothetical protein
MSVSWAGLGVMLGISVVAFIFGLILLRIFQIEEREEHGGRHNTFGSKQKKKNQILFVCLTCFCKKKKRLLNATKMMSLRE